MSDPVKSIEIEDVLSSIRRLLADGEGQGGAGTGAAQDSTPDDTARRGAVAPSRVRPERRGGAPLVLTPALRVAGRAEAEPTPFPGQSPHRPTGAAQAPLDDDDFEATDLAAEPAGQGGTLRSRLKETIAELEAAITHQPDEWEPDGSEQAPVMDWSSARAEDAPFLSRRHPGAAQRPAASAPREMRGTPVAEAAFHDGMAEGEAFDAAQEQPTPQAQNARAPEPTPAFAPQPEATQASVAAPAPQAEAPAAQPEAPAPMRATEPDGFEAAAAPGMIDEDMLRRVVTEVLREELRGPLGDRITSNLRKLVRREIFRALASSEFE